MRPQVCSQVASKALTGPSPEPLSSTPALQFAVSDGERAPASCADPDRPLGHVPAPVTMLDQQSLKVGIPNVARIYNYLLGGKDNYSADREAAMELVRLVPEVLTACRNNRRFLQRAVRFLAGEAEMLAGTTPDELNRAIRADWTRRQG